MLADGTVVRKGLGDSGGRVLIERAPGHTDYVLELLWGLFKVSVPPECWEGAPEKFDSCAYWFPREDTQAQKDQATTNAREMEERTARKNARFAWANREINPERQAGIIASAMVEHRNWMKSPAAELNVSSYSCRTLTLPNPGPEANRWFEQGRSLSEGQERDEAFVKAAELGHWRAAARLASRMLEDEDWESAQPVIAWLLSRNIPAGYNKLADLLEARGGYDGASPGDALRSFVTALRWRAAQSGDPAAQSLMSKFFQGAGRQGLANALLDCARGQNPEIR
jgi:hypothetical protein